MKFNVSSKTLYNYASAVSKIINSKNAFQILNSFLFTLNGDTLSIKGADMDNSLVARFPVNEAEGSGSFCIDARRMVELFKLMPDQGVKVIVDDDTLEVTIDYASGKHKTVAVSGEEFPAQKATQSVEQIEFVAPTSTVISGMDNTIFAVGTDEIRPQMMGVLWDVKLDKLIFVSTDTRKLVRYTNTAVQPEVECSFILPAKGAAILKSTFAKSENIKITVSAVNVVFETEDLTFDCRLINGHFPDYNRVIPQDNPYTLVTDRLTLLNAVRRVAVGGEDGSNLVKIRLADGVLTLQSQDPGYNTSASETVSCNYTGADLLIGFDSTFMIDILNTFSTPDILVHLGDPSRPALFKPSEEDPGSDLAIILMPMNILS